MELSAAEKLLYTTVKLNRFKLNQPLGSGTGFFYNVRLDGGKIAPLIITNKHVVAGADRIEAVCHQAVPQALPNEMKPSGQFLNLQISVGPAGAVSHPSPDVDLCVLPIANLMDQAMIGGTPMLFMHLDNSVIPKGDDWDYFDAMEEVVMIGCPNGIYDDFNKMPLARRGITATPIAKRYEGKPHFLVDMACFPGSSGSPIFLFNQNGFIDRKTNTNRIGATRLLRAVCWADCYEQRQNCFKQHAHYRSQFDDALGICCQIK